MPEIGTQLPAPAPTLPLPGLPSPPTNLSLPAGQAPVALSVFVMGPPSPLFLHLLLSVSPEEEASTQPSCPQRPGTPNVEWAQDSGEVSESRSEAGEGRLPLWHLWLHGASLRRHRHDGEMTPGRPPWSSLSRPALLRHPSAPGATLS